MPRREVFYTTDRYVSPAYARILMSKPAIAKVWTMPSSSGTGNYETLLYVDLTTSCGCPGWTRRTTANGARSCKHTRSVDMGSADHLSTARHDYRPDVIFRPGTGWTNSTAAIDTPIAAPSLRKAPATFGMGARKLAH